jgi:myo-inositol-1(or 4)-monophosphatase
MISDPELQLAIRAAEAAGEVLKAEFLAGSEVRSETAKDIKLAADVHAETRALGILRDGSPHAILSEEAGADAGIDVRESHWAVDPLDGTFNFSRGLPYWCVSVGLWRSDQPVLGVIHQPMTGVTYAGRVGSGAWLNGRPMRVSAVGEVSRAALATGFPAGRDFGRDSLAGFVAQAAAYKKVRLFGSAALSLAHVAAGALEVYHEEDIQFWDVAGGLALVAAAGGSFRMEPGASRWQRHVFASNGLIPPQA